MSTAKRRRLRGRGCIRLLASFVLAAWLPAIAAEVTVVDGRYEGDRFVRLRGQIVAGDLARVQQASREALRSGRNSLALLLSSPGGEVREAIKIGRWAREMMATTYVYGNTFYLPGTPDGTRLEAVFGQSSQTRFHLRATKSGEPLPEGEVTRCWSSCVLVFYGGVSRFTSDNLDFRQGRREIAVMGLHRPFYSPEHFGALTPSQAEALYRRIDTEVREYLTDMGAPQTVIERMFRSSSKQLDRVSSSEFRQYFRTTEPFFDEWQLAKCTTTLSPAEMNEYEDFRARISTALSGKVGQFSSIEQFETATLGAEGHRRYRELLARTIAVGSERAGCLTAALRQVQLDAMARK